MMDFYHCSSLYNSSFAVAIFYPTQTMLFPLLVVMWKWIILMLAVRHVINPAYVRGTGTIAIRLKISIIIDKYFLF